MGIHIESLESRRLFSAASAVAALTASGETVAADDSSLISLGDTSYQTILSDFESGGGLAASKSALKKLVTDSKAVTKVLDTTLTKSSVVIPKDVRALAAVYALYSADPGKASLAVKVTKAGAKLEADGQHFQSAIDGVLVKQSTVDSANVSRLLLINASNTKLKADVDNTIGPQTDAARSKLSSDVATSLTTDVLAVVQAYAITG